MPGRLRRITVYETHSQFYIVGCDCSGTKFNMLKIDRVSSKVLLTGEPDVTYTSEEILEILATISEGNSIVYRSGGTGKKPGHKGLIERVNNAYGILGFVRFLEGYYMIVITKATVVASFGYHSILKIAEVAMISITMDGVSTSSEEQRYVRIFQSVDLSTDFYFSYTYDLSRSLQENAMSIDELETGTRTLESDKKFIWNTFLLDPLRTNLVSEKWFVEVVHGYVHQQILDLPCSKLSMMLVGRRSAEYAGTRFLKRGANLKGSVANDVETEQILWDIGSSPMLTRGRFSSFVQRRGSVPLRWSQDQSKRGVVGKPPIMIDIHEPHAQTAAAHFRDLRKKYGSPIVVMNLVKRREKRRHEVVLHERFIKAVDYLNQFLPQSERICYLAFDVARWNKASTVTTNVLTKMDEIAMKAVQKHGWFQSFEIPHSRQIFARSCLSEYKPKYSDDGKFILQSGISRTNCVDCLDRTNVAQFAIGKAALACQLYSIGVLEEPYLSLQSEVVRVFEEMFDQHGDTMAWQYAGSQLVHSIKTYKKTAAFQERSRDVLQTLSRYYSNTFGDYDKQAAINLFLGKFRPQISSLKSLWDLGSDYYLHFPTTLQVTTDYCAWMYDDDEIDGYVMVEIGDCAEEATEDNVKEHEGTPSNHNNTLMLNFDEDYRDYYRTFEMTTLEPKVKHLAAINQRAIALTGLNDDVINTGGQFSKLWKSEPGKASKTASNDSDEDEDDVIEGEGPKEEDVLEYNEAWNSLMKREDRERRRDKDSPGEKPNILATGLRFAKDIYGLSRKGPSKETRDLYNSYVSQGGFKLDPRDWQQCKPTLLTDLKYPSVTRSKERRQTVFTTDDVFQVGESELSDAAVTFYNQSCDPGSHSLSKKDAATFAKYPNVHF